MPSISLSMGYNQDDIISQLPENVNTILHCAGAIKPPSQSSFFSENIEGTQNILNEARRLLPALRRVVLLSSQSVAGPCEQGQSKCESDACNPVSQYGISKAKMERTIIERFPDMPLIIVRPPSVYGPGDRESLSFFKMVRFGIIPCVNNNRMTLSFVYIDDLIEGIYRLATAPDVPEKVYYITSQDEVNISDFYKIISKYMDKKYLVLNLPKPLLTAAAVISMNIGVLTGTPFMLNSDKVKEMMELRWWLVANGFEIFFPT